MQNVKTKEVDMYKNKTKRVKRANKCEKTKLNKINVV